MTIKAKLFAAAIALSLAAPLAPTTAQAAPHGNMMMSGRHDAVHDRNHRPPLRAERRPPMPHRGHYRWHPGAWTWKNGGWAWTSGLWIRF